ncbi:aldolase [Aestuariimicrobium sp. p3-SID1156]|uniref:aldolase n=1 Tax=Aestuariimicrobium sp. p3-SID1156 TaxID=2916038 RepID=UPI00223BC691|nr:aldolase [Aestuariimicrobium sp. p3-SID1156]MCT1458296.1 aldolase [Aestuariimicrobium sp. p3-SID1156]
MLPECIQQSRLIVLLDRRRSEDADRDARLGVLVPVLEVMVQEGLRTFGLDSGDLDVFAEVREIFDERADFGLYNVDDHDRMARMVEQRPAFILLNNDDPDLVWHGQGQGIATLPAALTPNEIGRAAKLGAPAVQVMPADLFGSSFPDQLNQVLPGVVTIPRGGLGGWAIGRWFEAGAQACIADTNLIGDSLNGGNLSHLRDRARSFRDVIPSAEAGE